MPFDSSEFNRESPLLTVLRKARERISNYWIKGKLTERRMTVNDAEWKYGFCLLGSIWCEDDGAEKFNGKRPINTPEHKAETLMKRAIYLRTKVYGSNISGVPDYNDSSVRTLEEVLTLLDDVTATVVRMEALDLTV